MELTLNSGELTRGSNESAGYDIHASEDAVIKKNKTTAIETNLNISISPNHVGLIQPRSGLAFNNSIDTLAGVIDSDYKGDIKVLLINHGTKEYKVSKGDRIAQIVFLPIPSVRMTVNKKSTFHSPNNERGTKGFGSTDKQPQPEATNKKDSPKPN